jgi:hypothetical protein
VCSAGYGSYVTATELETQLPTTAPSCEEVGSNGCTCSVCPQHFATPSGLAGSRPIAEAKCYFTVTIVGLFVADTQTCTTDLTDSIADATAAFLNNARGGSGVNFVVPIEGEAQALSRRRPLEVVFEGGGPDNSGPSVVPNMTVARADCLPVWVSGSYLGCTG